MHNIRDAGNPTSTKINKAGSDFHLPKADRVPGTFDPNRPGIAKLGLPIRPSIPGENGHSGPMDCLAYSSTQHATLLTPGTAPKRTAQGLTGSTPGTIRHRHRTSTLLGGPHKDPSTAAADLETDQKRAYYSAVGVGHD